MDLEVICMWEGKERESSRMILKLPPWVLSEYTRTEPSCC